MTRLMLDKMQSYGWEAVRIVGFRLLRNRGLTLAVHVQACLLLRDIEKWVSYTDFSSSEGE